MLHEDNQSASWKGGFVRLRLPRLRLLTIYLVLCAFAAVPLCFAADRPNFVWLISEDNSKHYLKLFDENGAETPRIAKLAEAGLIFEHAFSNSPVCSVARSTLITGCYAPRIGTQNHRRSVLVPLPGDLRMFPAYLRDAGYYTTNKDKKDYNAVEGEGVWDESSNEATWRDRRDEQPFFHMQTFGTSHEASLHFSEEDMKSLKTKTDPASIVLPPDHPDTATFRYTYARYHHHIRQVDRQIGAVIDQLDADGLLEDTFIFYFGDHGGVLPGSKGYANERGLHVPLVVRIPENWTHLTGGAKRGSRVKGFVSFIDFGPTLLSLAGIDVPDAVDGLPFLGEGVDISEVNSRDEAFGYADRFDEKFDLVRTLRKGRFKYVRSYQPFNFDGLQNNYRYNMLAYAEWRDLYRDGRLNAVQRRFFERRPPEALYDIENDPYETKNLAGDPAHANTLADLRHRLAKIVKALPDLSLYPESILIEEAFKSPVTFGQTHQDAIARLVDIADLSLLPFTESREGIEAALESRNPWVRYWGLIACSSHGEAAKGFAEKARIVAANDPELLVRVRAAEFLGLLGAGDPRPTLMAALKRTQSGVEAALILNTVVLLRDGKPGYRFSVTAEDINPAARHSIQVQRRLAYLE
jgi:arylsulfatase A-like enzyme